MSTTICHSCGRPLRDPRSVETGIGPICAAKRSSDFGPRLFKSDYFYEIIDGVLVLFDRDCGSISLTNDIENVLLEVARNLGNAMPGIVIYRDSEGQYDQVRHRNGVFGGFNAIAAKSLSEALARVKGGEN